MDILTLINNYYILQNIDPNIKDSLTRQQLLYKFILFVFFGQGGQNAVFPIVIYIPFPLCMPCPAGRFASVSADSVTAHP